MSGRTEYDGKTVRWEGELSERTVVTVGGQRMPFSRLVAMTNGDILDALAPGSPGEVRSEETEEAAMPDDALSAALAVRGITASGLVVAREGLPDGLEDPDGAVGRLLGDEGLGRAFDALVASGTCDKSALLATAVERSHEYYGVPGVLASGEARRWATELDDYDVEEMYYYEAPRQFERAQAEAVVAAARDRLRKQVLGG